MEQSVETSDIVRRHRELGRGALDDWGISGAELTLISRSENVVFRVDLPHGGRRVLRIHRPARAAVEIESELRWLDALRRETELVVPKPVRTLAGGWYRQAASAELPQPRACVLFGWLDGAAIPEPLTAELMAELGSVMARLHEHVGTFDPAPGFVRPRMDAAAFSPDRLPPGIVGSTQLGVHDQATCLSAAARIRHQLAELGTDREVYGLIHGDLHMHNCLRVAGELAPIDFDDCTFAPLAYDLAVPLEMAAERQDGADLEAALLDGYRSVRRIDPRTAAALPACRAARQLHLVGWLSANLDNPLLAEWAEVYLPAALAALADFTRH